MTSTMTRERMLMPPSNELDSECSSGGGDDNHHSHNNHNNLHHDNDQHQHHQRHHHHHHHHHHQVDLRRRLQTEDNLDSSSPKKRRKQTTPVRVPATLITTGDQMASEEDDDNNDDNGLVDEIDDLEGEITSAAHESHTERESDDEFIDKGKPTTLVSDQGMSKDENLNTEFRCLLCGSLFEDKDTLLCHRESEHDTNNLTRQSITQSPLSQNSLLPVAVKIEQQDESSDNPVNLSSGFNLNNFTNTWVTGATQQAQIQESEWSSQNSLMISGQLSCLPYPNALTQYLPIPTFPMTESGQLPRNVVGGSAPIRIFNPDAYCELCNKEFCNKYFLKTHKANKHGIYIDQPSSSTPGANDNGLLSYPNSLFPSVNIKIEPQQQQPQLQLSQQQKLETPEISPVSMIPTIPCDICQKRFKNEELLKKHKQKVHVEQISDHTDSQSLPATGLSEDDCREMPSFNASPSNIEALVKQDYGIEQEDAKFMPAPRQLSPQLCQQLRECGFSVDKLRSLGVINPDVFCELCCKEYCNKHFLRIHKIKRHGILMQSNGKSPNNPGAAASWHQIQTSPLNLIVSDAPAGSESTDKSEDYECKPCSIRFQTMGLYEMHKSKIHDTEEPKSPIGNMETEEIDSDQQPRPDTISQNLQKLQTMILQLNGLKPGNRPIVCGICSRECESKLALKTHMSLEHGTNILEESLSPSQQMIDSSFLTGFSTFCTLCEKDFRAPESLKQHLAEDHGHSTILTSNNNLSNVPQISTPAPTNQLPGPPIPPPADKKLSSMTPTSSYCEICNKELCNKYFMKTHMQRMHGIEIENGSQIGGVVCNICNKELCSKYFLRVHKHNTHGIVDEGTVGGATSSTIKPENFESSNSEDLAALKSNDQLGDMSHRYFSHFTEVCPVCGRRFRSIKWLKAHLLGDHGKVGVNKWRELEQQYQQNSTTGAKKFPGNSLMNRPVQPSPSLKIPNGFDIAHHLKPNDYGATLGKQVLSSLLGSGDDQNKTYRCSFCNFITPVLSFLFLHEKSHLPNENINLEPLQCPICSQGFTQPEMLHHHLVARHQVTGMQIPLSIIANQANLSLEGNQVERDGTDHQESSGGIEENNKHGNVFPAQTNFDPIKNNRDEQSLNLGAVSATTATATILVTPQVAYKCAQCGLATTNLNRIKKHVKKDHKSIGDPADNVIAELTKTLHDLANKHKVPVSYAIPQDTNSNPDTGTIMQPFIIEEKDCGFSSDDSRGEKKFSPVLIYLPVRTRVTGVLTTSFTLSPA
ncbi:uncharacterized protein LOC123269893 [Cotesia glomerata]|uniref:uncharacterized protein LOC123269893 n=1 Tax=Cotesia glomerata TaxID=32391 RepID=UPI001D0311A8|nr:uncharacterized protein LOC123269893 [Cotesia glomerata]